MIEQIPFQIGVEQMSDELIKYHVSNGAATPWPFTPVIHHFKGPDKDGPHDHPFGFRVFVVAGGYKELRYEPQRDGTYVPHYIHRLPGSSFFVPAETIHEIVRLPHGECWTIIIPEPKTREPHFYQFDMYGKAQRRRWDESEFKPFNNQP